MQVANVKVQYIRPKYKNLKEWMADANNLYIGRGGIVFIDNERFPKQSSPWANPFPITKDHDRKKVLELYLAYIVDRINKRELNILELDGKTLGCWCHPEPCHGHLLVELLKRVKAAYAK